MINALESKGVVHFESKGSVGDAVKEVLK